MRHRYLLSLVLLLTGCGQPSTPLTHALAALRAGDYDDFLKAKEEADATLKTAVQPDGDICKLSVLDLIKYSDVERIARFNHPELFKMPDDERLAYAFQIAGDEAEVGSGSFLARVPFRAIVMGDRKEAPNCPAMDASELQSVRSPQFEEKQAQEEARLHQLQDWVGDAKQRYGDELDSKMKSAASHLSDAGFTAKWPPKTDLIGYAQLPEFHRVNEGR